MAIFRRCSCTYTNEDGKVLRYPQLPDRPTDAQKAKACPRLVADPKHGLWGFALSRGFDGTGKRLQVRKGNFATKREAQSAYAAAKAADDNGTFVESTALTLGQHLVGWLAVKAKRDGLRPSTLDAYTDKVERIIMPSRLAAMRLTDVRRRDVTDFIGGLDHGVETLKKVRQVLRGALEYAVEEELIVVNPALSIRLPKQQRRLRTFWTPAEAAHFLDVAAGHRLGLLFTVAMLTGLRRGEVLGLRWSDVDLENRTLTVTRTIVMVKGKAIPSTPKTDSGVRRVDLEDDAVGTLLEWRLRQDADRDRAGAAWNEGGWVFTMEDGSSINPDSLRRLAQRLQDRAGLPHIAFHGLRHEHASLLIDQGENIARVSKRLGHKNINITSDLYGHLVGDASRNGAAKVASLLASYRTAQPLHNAGGPAEAKEAPTP